MIGATVNAEPLLGRPPSFTTMLPVVAVPGTVTVMLLADQELMGALWPLNVTIPALEPKLVPAIVIDVPGAPLVGVTLVIVGASIVNAKPLLDNPPLVTTMLPLVAAPGTVTTIWVLFQEFRIAGAPLKVTVPAIGPKLLPEILTDVPAPPMVGPTLLIAGGTVAGGAAAVTRILSKVTVPRALVLPLVTPNPM